MGRWPWSAQAAELARQAPPSTPLGGNPLRGASSLYLAAEALLFARDPLGFTSARAAEHGRVFATYFPSVSRRLSGTTAVASGYEEAVGVLLAQPAVLSAATAYAEYLTAYEPGSNLILASDCEGDASKHATLRARYAACLGADAIAGYMPLIARVVDTHAHELRGAARAEQSHFAPYGFAKLLFDQLTAVLLLGEDPCVETYVESDTRRWRREHFAALTAAPVHINIAGRKSCLARGVDAREALLGMLRTRIKAARCASASSRDEDSSNALVERPSSVLEYLVRADEDGANDEEVAHHLLMLANAVSSKAPAAVLTYLILELTEDNAKREKCIESDAYLAACLHETLRLHPPLLGGLRRALEPLSVAGFHIPAGHRVWYSCRHANTDPSTYRQPHEFIPERWMNDESFAPTYNNISKCPFSFATGRATESSPPHVSFGAGRHRCPGRDLAWAMIMHVAKSLLRQFDFSRNVTPGNSLADHNARCFPVLRPEGQVTVNFEPRQT